MCLNKFNQLSLGCESSFEIMRFGPKVTDNLRNKMDDSSRMKFELLPLPPILEGIGLVSAKGQDSKKFNNSFGVLDWSEVDGQWTP